MKNFVEVHIAPVWNKHERVHTPIEHHAPDVVYLLEDERSDVGDAESLCCAVDDAGCHVRRARIDLFDMYEVMGSVTTLADRHRGDVVRVNVTSGTKHAAIGATMACMDDETVAEPYSVTEARPARAEERGNEPTFDTGTALDIYPIDSPTRDQLAALAVIAACNVDSRRTKYRTIIDKGVELDFECFRNSAGGKARYGKLRTYIVDPLREKEYIEVDAVSSKSKYVTVTDSGRQALRAFRHRVEDVIETLEASPEPNVDLDLDDPIGDIEHWADS